MIKPLLLALALLAPLAHAQQTLNSLKGSNRVLLIFAPDTLDPRFVQQVDRLTAHIADLGSRDLVLLPVVPDATLSTAPPALRALRPPLVHADEKITLRRRFHIGPFDFAVILLGKDGGERLRSAKPVTIVRLEQAIDAKHR